MEDGHSYDLFISHAGEDQEGFVRPLAARLVDHGYRVWYSEWTLTLGDGLREAIDRGLLTSRFGVVVLSPRFFAKHWPKRELDGLAALESDGVKRILPIWHDVTSEEVARFSPMLADRLAVPSDRGLDRVVEAICEAVGGPDRPVEALHRNPRLLAERVKQLMVSDGSRIALQDMILSTVGDITKRLQSSNFAASERPTKELIVGRVVSYDQLLADILQAAAIGSYWSNSDQLDDWIRSIQRVANANSRRASGMAYYTAWSNLEWYPAMVLLYACGLGAIANRKYGTLWRLLTEPAIRDGDKTVSPSSILSPMQVAGDDVGKALPGKSRHKTPMSDYLLEMFEQALPDLFDDAEDLGYSFDEFETWLALSYLDRVDREWMPSGRFIWLRRDGKWPRVKFNDESYRAKVLAAGAFWGDAARLSSALERFDAFTHRYRDYAW